jgi:phage/plasmid-associated DNA primase
MLVLPQTRARAWSMTLTEKPSKPMLQKLLAMWPKEEIQKLVAAKKKKDKTAWANVTEASLKAKFEAMYKSLDTKGSFQQTYEQNEYQGTKRGRRYGKKFGAQGMDKRLRHLLYSLYRDLDVCNAHPEILRQLCHHFDIPCPQLDAYCEKRDSMLEELVTGLKISRKEAKELVLKVTNAGSSDIEVQDSECQVPVWFPQYATEMKSIRTEMMKHFEDIYEITKQDKEKEYELQKVNDPNIPYPNIPGAFINQVLCEMEDYILCTIVEFLSIRNIECGVLAFDGVMIIYEGDVDQLLGDISDYIKEKTGFVLKLAEKTMDMGIDLQSEMQVVTLHKKVTKNLEKQIKNFIGVRKSKDCKELFVDCKDGTLITNDKFEILDTTGKFMGSLAVGATLTDLPTSHFTQTPLVLHESTKYKEIWRAGTKNPEYLHIEADKILHENAKKKKTAMTKAEKRPWCEVIQECKENYVQEQFGIQITQNNTQVNHFYGPVTIHNGGNLDEVCSKPSDLTLEQDLIWEATLTGGGIARLLAHVGKGRIKYDGKTMWFFERFYWVPYINGQIDDRLRTFEMEEVFPFVKAHKHSHIPDSKICKFDGDCDMEDLKKLKSLSEVKMTSSMADLLDKDPNLIGFIDGVYDLEKGEFRSFVDMEQELPDSVQNLLLSKNVGFPYPKHQGDLLPDLERLFEQIHPDKDIREYVLRSKAMALHGDRLCRNVHFYTGEGRNGKTLESTLDEATFGDYYVDLPAGYLQRIKNSGPDPETCELRGKRMAVSSEPQDSKLQSDVIKKLSGGDRTRARDLFASGKLEKFTLNVHLFILCNKRLKFDGEDGGMRDRVRLVPFNSKFVDRESDVDQKNHKYRSDESLKSKIWQWRESYMWWLLNKWYDHNWDGDAPSSVKEATCEYLADNNVFEAFVNATFVKRTSDFDFGVSVVQVETLWETWLYDNKIKETFTSTQRNKGLDQIFAGRSLAANKGNERRCKVDVDKSWKPGWKGWKCWTAPDVDQEEASPPAMDHDDSKKRCS